MSDEPSATDASRHGPEEPLDLDDLTDEVLPALIARLRASRLGELEVGGDGWRVRLRRAPRGTRHEADGRPTAAGAVQAAAATDNGVARSPGVGYFQPGTDLFVGAIVQAGDVLGGLDVLGIVQEVSAPTDGIVSRVLAEAGQAVEYGQALAEIDPLTAPGDDPDARDEVAT